MAGPPLVTTWTQTPPPIVFVNHPVKISHMATRSKCHHQALSSTAAQSRMPQQMVNWRTLSHRQRKAKRHQQDPNCDRRQRANKTPPPRSFIICYSSIYCFCYSCCSYCHCLHCRCFQKIKGKMRAEAVPSRHPKPCHPSRYDEP